MSFQCSDCSPWMRLKPGKQSRWVSSTEPKPSLTCWIRESVALHSYQRTHTISLIHLHTHTQTHLCLHTLTFRSDVANWISLKVRSITLKCNKGNKTRHPSLFIVTAVKLLYRLNSIKRSICFFGNKQ